MTNSARLSGRPSSSAAYNVGDVVDTPDSAIKSWRYLGAGEWEPNDAVRYTTGPDGVVTIPRTLVAISMEEYYALLDPDPGIAYFILAAMSASAYAGDGSPIAPVDYTDDAGMWRAYVFTGNGSFVVAEGGTPEWLIVGGGGCSAGGR